MSRGVYDSPVRTYVTWVLVSLLLFGLERIGWLAGVRSAAESVLVPVEKAIFASSWVVRSPLATIRYWRTGAARIADLERQVASLSVDAARLAALEEENRAMRELLGAPLPASWRFIPAPITGRGSVVSRGVGEVDGVAISDVVVWDEVMIGTVVELTARQSRVRLLTDPQSKIPVYLPVNGADGLLEGRFGSQMVLTQVLQSFRLPTAAQVVSSGASGAPRGLLVGTVGEIQSDATALYQEALVNPVVNLDMQTTLFVLKENRQSEDR